MISRNQLFFIVAILGAFLLDSTIAFRERQSVSYGGDIPMPEGPTRGDNPTYTEVASSSLKKCKGKEDGYYTEPGTGCKGFYRCYDDGSRYATFTCGEQTRFNPASSTCEHSHNVDCPEPVKLNVEKVEPEPLYLEITADGHVFPKTKKALCQRRRHKGPSELE